MSFWCCVTSCQLAINASNRGYSIPKVNLRFSEALQEKQKLRRHAWLTNIRQKESDGTGKSRVVCSRHFICGMFQSFIFNLLINMILCS